jgi:ATP phosphoribosyltransferase
VRVVLVRATDVPTYVEYGGADLGVTGKDTLLEHGGQGLYQPLDLRIAKCRMSVAVRADFDYASAVRQGSRLAVATKYTTIAREFFATKGVHVDLIKLYGSMELAPLTGLADAIVDLVSTGNTLKANHLVEVERIMDISSRLVVNQASLKLKQAPIRAIIDAFAGAFCRTLNHEPESCSPSPVHHRSGLRGGLQGAPALVGRHRCRDRAARGRHPGRCAGTRRCGRAGLHPALRRPGGRLDGRAGADAGRAERPRSTPCPQPRSQPWKRRPPGAQLPRGAEKASGESWSYRDEDGTLLGQKVTPLDRVGIYVPGGKAAYPSSVLMNAIPAHVAGVGEIIMVVPTPRGERNALVLAAAYVAGVTRAFTLGGAQAVAALAYGTATVPKVDKITGPGNAYVASAKKRVFGTVGIDMIAGPSEILVLADGSTPADWVAMDLFSQAEHDELAQSILLCPDAAYIEAVQAAIDRLLPAMPRREIIARSLNDRGALILTRSMEEACEISNRIAPEHLEVSSRDPHRWEPLLRHAGAIFLGAYTSESLGDYCAGPNHVLPTSGTARFSSPAGGLRLPETQQPDRGQRTGRAAAGPDRRRTGLWRRPAGPRPRRRIAAVRCAPHESVPMSAVSPQLLKRIRQDVQSMHAYAIQDSVGMVKLDAMENPYSLPHALQVELGQRLGALALNRYPDGRVNDLRHALAAYAGMPAGFDIMLGNGSDELISLLAMACDVPGASILAPVARLRDVRDERAAARAGVPRRAADGRL